MKITYVCALSVFTVSLLSNVSLYASSIGINFTASNWSLQPSDQPGVVASANWNNVSGSTRTNVPLQDDTAVLTSALLTFQSKGSYADFSATNTPNAATNILYRGGLFGDNTVSEVTINLTGIPYANYDVYVYSSPDTDHANLLSITDGIMTYYYRSGGQSNGSASSLLQTTSTDSLNPTVGAGQYQVFTGLTDSTFSVTTGGSINNLLSNNVFGLQIVETPEPTSMALLLSAFGITVFGRRFRKG